MAAAETLLAVLLPVIVGLALIGIANVVMRNGRDHRHNLYFAALYFLSGMKSLSEGLAVNADDFHATAVGFPPRAFWELLGVFCALGMLPLLLLFVCSFPRPMGWMLRSPGLATLAFLPSAAIAALLILFIVGVVPAETYIGAAQGFNVLFFAVTLAAIVLLVRTRIHSPDAIERTQATYVLLGFLPAFVTGWAVSAIQLGVVGLDAQTAQDSIATILHYVSPTLELVACSLVGFAILKYNLLGINPRFRLGVKSALFGAMVVSLFLATQFIENVILQGKVFSFADSFTGGYGSFILSGATSLVLFKPIEKVSGRVSDKLLPGAAVVARAREVAETAGHPEPKPTIAAVVAAVPVAGAMPAPAAAAAMQHLEHIYQAQCTYVLRDAHVTERELALLRNLRTQLGLGDEQARRIEETVERLLKVDAPQTGRQAVGTVPATQGVVAHASELSSGALQVRLAAKEPPTVDPVPGSPKGPA